MRFPIFLLLYFWLVKIQENKNWELICVFGTATCQSQHVCSELVIASICKSFLLLYLSHTLSSVWTTNKPPTLTAGCKRLKLTRVCKISFYWNIQFVQCPKPHGDKWLEGIMKEIWDDWCFISWVGCWLHIFYLWVFIEGNTRSFCGFPLACFPWIKSHMKSPSALSF